MKSKNNLSEFINANKNTLTFKIWLYFFIFAIALFIILWFMQVIFIQSYYSSMKKSEVHKIAENIEIEYNNSDAYEDYIDNIAYKNAASIFIFDKNSNMIYSSNNSSGQGNVTQMPTRPVTIDTSEFVEKIQSSPIKRVNYTLKIDKFKSELYVYGMFMQDSGNYLVIVSSIDPIDATTTVLQSQLLYITFIALLIASIISVFISRRLSRPIKNINEETKKLARGNYNVTFEKAGYKELDDLVDTLNFTTKELAKTDKIKKELIANVSHDLRTPLTMIKAYSEMIRDLSGDNKEKREEHLKVIIDETDRLTTLVNDMMDISKIESGLLVLNKETVDICELVKNIVERFKMANNLSDFNLVTDIPKEAYVRVDKSKIQQVLYNLISNAINHSGNSKEIKVKIDLSPKKVKISVIDNGIGIKKEDLPHIWSRYYKSTESFKRPDSGSGLGLSIVKNILDIHKADYGVESEYTKGACFWFELDRVNKPKKEIAKIAKSERINNKQVNK